MLIDKSLGEYIDLAGSKNPTPGGGSVSALVGSLGGALTRMVGNLTLGKKAFEDLDESIKKEFNENFQKMEELLLELKLIVDEDARAFDKVMEAFKMPKKTDLDREKRSEAIEAGYKLAMEVPFRCSQLCLEGLRIQEVFANYGNINAITDVGVGVLLLYAGLEGALLNVRINLSSIKDENYRKEVSKSIDFTLSEGRELKDEVLKIVYKRLA